MRSTTSLSLPAATTREPLLSGRLVAWIFTVNLFMVLGFWWTASGRQPMHGTADALNAGGRVTALVGTYLVLWQLLMMSRLPLLHEALRSEVMLVLHRWNGYAVLGLMLAHAGLQTAGYELIDRRDTLGELRAFVLTYPGLLDAVVALGLLLVVTVLSVAIARRRLRYETWYFVHLYAYLAVALAFLHQLATGGDFIGNPIFSAYWVILYLLVGSGILWFRVAKPLVRLRRHGLRVERVVREAPGVHSVYVSGRRLEELAARPGQFALWRFLDGKRWWEAHPFSISSVPAGRWLRLTVKGIGDFSTRIQNLRTGTPVLLEGPFGGFTTRLCELDRVLLIAGGVGITPLRALAEEMLAAGFDVRLLYRCRRERDLIFKAELDGMASYDGLRVDYLLSEGQGSAASREWFHPRRLAALVPDIREREVFICGPAGMMAEVRQSLARLALPGRRIHVEAFRF